ncbi:ATP-binding protein [Paraburkholderia sp. SOS3]|jgi:signal transduction histidine kinase|uniref:ATP-binding protein n=1 Tax=Paraburkholderia sp. SOS3 TaxID=1926494 RepID=UPI00094731D4|nr:ATP-binding protein [Paraburkholderia sp. SOS3]APR39676.1 two-component sensor histidine kinase [Paraburkholderia sp. SOS3]
MRFLPRLWPDSLFGRLVTILAIGMFAGQLLTSTIWFDTHESRALEVPARLFASRLADTVRLIALAPDDAARRALAQQLGDPKYRIEWLAAGEPGAAVAKLTGSDRVPIVQRVTGDLMRGVLARRLGATPDMRLLEADVHDDSGKRGGILSLFDSSMPTGDFHVQLKLHGSGWDGWLDVRANEGQADALTEPHSLALDYLVRLYLIRFTAVCVLAFIAVRFAVQPLRQLAKAADALGRNIHRPPLPVTGPSEVRSAAQSFNAMQQQLADSIAQRTRFLTAVSHDLRSPLTRLRLRTEMLPDPDWRDRLRGDLDEMEAMVTSTLDAVQGIEITETRHAIDIDSMLEGLAQDLRETGRAVSVTGCAGRPVPGYPRNLKRCLQNLLDNAIRYGECADVLVTDMGRSVRIVISDRGPGIADATQRERVFEPYVRLASKEGTGLGLTISRSVAAAHGGTLTLENREGRGLDAVLVLPRED